MAQLYGLMRLGRDAEVRRTPGGDAVVNLSLAYNYGQKGDDNNRPTQWVDAALWGQRAESLAPFLTKGSLHLFTLRDIHMEKYADKEGFDAYKLAATVADVELGPKGDGASNAGGGASTGQRRPASGATSAQRPGGSSAPAGGGTPADDMDDDIPF